MKTLIGPLSFLTLKPLLLFLIFECYLWLLGFSIDFFNTAHTAFTICIFLTVFQRFDELALSLCRRVFCSFQKQCCNKPTTDRCCHQEVFRQICVRKSWQQQNSWKIFLNELRFNKNTLLQHATLITAILQNSFQRHIYNPVEHLRCSVFAKIVEHCSRMFQKCSFKITIEFKI